MNPLLPPGPRNVLPPQPGDGHHTPSNRTHVLPNEVHLQVAPDVPIVTFWQALQYWWINLWNEQAPQSESDNLDVQVLTPPQIWFVLNVSRRVTPVRIFWFLLGSVSFLCALGTFLETQIYISTIGGRGSLVRVAFSCVLVTTHTVVLAFLLLSGFCNAACERYRRHFLIKSVGDFLVMLGACLLILKIGRNQTIYLELVLSPFGAPTSLPRGAFNAVAYPLMAPNDRIRFSEISGIVTCALLTVDALSIINLLRPGPHDFIFEIMTTLTMHLSLELLNRRPYLGAFAASFIFIIIVVKNFIWRDVVNGQAPGNQQHTLALVPV